MRYQGHISDWNDERGFGFITPGGGGERVFLHISAYTVRSCRPQLNDRVTYVLAAGPKGPQAQQVMAVIAAVAPSKLRSAAPSRRGSARRGKGLWLLFLAGLLGASWLFTGNDRQTALTPSTQAEPFIAPQAGRIAQPAVSESSRYQCEGKTRCTEMTSCEEAMFYLNHCPGSLTDGDGDGRPCEDWCGH